MQPIKTLIRHSPWYTEDQFLQFSSVYTAASEPTIHIALWTAKRMATHLFHSGWLSVLRIEYRFGCRSSRYSMWWSVMEPSFACKWRNEQQCLCFVHQSVSWTFRRRNALKLSIGIQRIRSGIAIVCWLWPTTSIVAASMDETNRFSIWTDWNRKTAIFQRRCDWFPMYWRWKPFLSEDIHQN